MAQLPPKCLARKKQSKQIETLRIDSTKRLAVTIQLDISECCALSSCMLLQMLPWQCALAGMQGARGGIESFECLNWNLFRIMVAQWSRTLALRTSSGLGSDSWDGQMQQEGGGRAGEGGEGRGR